VHVRAITPDGHCRTPFYIRGKTGRVIRDHGAFRNPEQLAYGQEGLPKKELYLVEFAQGDVWPGYAAPQDRIALDIFEHWLEPAEER
jgi:nitrile hydratase